jgi:hypothetical protein
MVVCELKLYDDDTVTGLQTVSPVRGARILAGKGHLRGGVKVTVPR